MQLLLVRHALPVRNEHGEGSDPELSEGGWEQARRLPDALARFPISRLVSSPQRRAIQTAEPVAAARDLPVEIDDRLAEYDRDLPQYVPIEHVRTENPEEWARMAQGRLPSTVDEGAFRARVRAAIDDVVAAADPDDTVAIFSHGGVINVLLHEIAGHGAAAVLPDRLRVGDSVAVLALRPDHRGQRQRHRPCVGSTPTELAMSAIQGW
jgi:broad specificity phosphatase PhoE